MKCPGSREVIPWDEYWMNQAKAIAGKSADPSSQVGCVIVDAYNENIGQGYNGFVAGIDESFMTWDRPDKYFLVVHAEVNAVFRAINKPGSQRVGKVPVGSIAYVTDAPCEACLRNMLQVGLREVYYDKPDIMWKRSSPDQKKAIERLIKGSGIVVKNFNTKADYLEDLARPIPVEVK